MKMLDSDERHVLEYLAGVANGAPRQEFTTADWAPFYKATGNYRAKAGPTYLETGDTPHFITDWGLKALRIDDLIKTG